MVCSLGGLNRSAPMRLKILEKCLSKQIRDRVKKFRRPGMAGKRGGESI